MKNLRSAVRLARGRFCEYIATMAIHGVGTDIVELARIERVWKKYGDRFVRRILSPEEVDLFLARNSSLAFLAGRFAAKEAVFKALGMALGWRDMSVVPSTNGALRVSVRNHQIDGKHVHLSISHEQKFAVAFAVVETQI